MGWVDVREPFAAPPRFVAPDPSDTSSDEVEFDGGWGELAEVAVEAVSIDAEPGDRLDITGSTLRDVTVAGGEAEIEAFRSSFDACDLSRVRFPSLRAARLADCKLVGVDLSGAEIADVVFERCILRFANMRMTRLRRVAFVDCTLHEVDAYDLDAEDVSFAGCDLDTVNIDRLRATRVDLRGARRLGLDHLGSLAGCLVGEEQLHAITYQLAFAAGLSVERSADGD